MKIIITGASGFIGKAIIDKLEFERHQVLAISRSFFPDKSDKIKFETADLSSLNSYKQKVIDFKPEVAIHLAWHGIPDFSYKNSILNVQISLDFLKLVMEQKSCKKVIIAGSCFELDNPNGACKESFPSTTKDHFTWAKKSIRDWLFMECERLGIKGCWMRIFYAYGPYQRLNSLIPTLLSYFQKAAMPPVKSVDNSNDFIFVSDVAEAFIKAINETSAEGTFHIGSGYSTSVLELCKISEKLVRNSSTFSDKLFNLSKKNFGPVNFWSDNTHSRHVLNWSPSTSINDGINKTWQWLRKI